MADSRVNATKGKRSSTRSGRRRTVHEHVTKGAIKRLARRGGVKRLTALIYDEMRLVLKKYLESLIRDSILYCDYCNRKTVQVEDVINALKNRGEAVYGFDDSPFPIKITSTIVLTNASERGIDSPLNSIASQTDVASPEGQDENISIMAGNSRDLPAISPDIELLVRKKSPRLNPESSKNTQTSANEDSDTSDSLISPEKLKEIGKALNTSKSALRSTEVPVDDPVPVTRRTAAERNRRLPLNERRRRLFPHYLRNNTQVSREPTAVAVNTNRPNTANQSDSDDFQDNSDLISIKRRKSSRKK